MNTQIIRKQAQAGFTLIELIVVIVILGILAATALPRMFDVSGQARMASMQAVVGSMRASQSTANASWLVAGGVLACNGCAVGGGNMTSSLVTAEKEDIPMFGGYPDVGGDGLVNTSKSETDGGMVQSLNLTGDYVVTTRGPLLTDADPTATHLSIAADEGHPNCRVTYTEAVQTGGSPGVPPTVTRPVITTDLLNVENCG